MRRSWAIPIPIRSAPGTTLLPPTSKPGGWPRPSHCWSAPSPTSRSSSAIPTPVRCTPGTTSRPLTRRPGVHCSKTFPKTIRSADKVLLKRSLRRSSDSQKSAATSTHYPLHAKYSQERSRWMTLLWQRERPSLLSDAAAKPAGSMRPWRSPKRLRNIRNGQDWDLGPVCRLKSSAWLYLA